MTSSLAPSLLLSMPQLVDPNFNRTVVLMCKHSEDGAFGLVVNRPLVTTGRIVVDIDPPAPAARARREDAARESESVTEQELQVWVGGPVEPERSWILVGDGPADEDNEPERGMRIAEGLYLSTSPDLLRRLLEPSPPPRARLMIGYSGWGPGQLEAELQASAWLISDVDRDLIFNTAPERMWEAAIRRLGADPAALHTSRGVH
jgi:putative transcriptional regulator